MRSSDTDTDSDRNTNTLEIRFFKGLESVELKECGKLNPLIGKNNSGKSSVLHAIDMAG
jgi:AAA15 family ATPase/GTPase